MTDLADLKTIRQVIARAREIVDPSAFAWGAAGAGDGVTVARNSIGLNSLALVPRHMRNVEEVDTATSFVGIPLAFPVMLAPVGALGIYDAGDALAAAAAATQVSTAIICSELTTSPWEDVAATHPGHHIFQMYVFGDRDWMHEVAARVKQAGFAAICVTVDTPILSRRDRSIEQVFGWSSPSPPNLQQHGSDPKFRARFTWEDLRWLVENSELPVIVKGVMTVEDAVAAVECGVAAIYVSNHGGRVVDHGMSTIEVLGEIVAAVGASVDVAVDSGFTSGADVCKALALGATAVGIGRLQCWGLAVGGTDGLVRVLDILKTEISITMANIGCREITEITPDRVRWSIPVPPSGPAFL
ncbi:MAG: alpha-hydroxy-acid oxidizing protein [Acidimicrobiia bacterium]|nr:alpha-hydroxy-acid oxidizing protein [Acidimicrobiia bacterium]